jgi:predicted adenylyl cyclase CyaB
MPSNIEIKARVQDLASIRARAEAISDGPAELLGQEDIFFATPSGRLKLRILGDHDGELIAYDRQDAPSPRPSRYLIAPTSDPTALKTILMSVLEVIGVVKKQRWLYRVGQTRIHLDQVEGLGAFVELEVVLRPDQPGEEGIAIAKELMEGLGITEDQLVEQAYIDLLSR